jgi:hypothetical protein
MRKANRIILIILLSSLFVFASLGIYQLVISDLYAIFAYIYLFCLSLSMISLCLHLCLAIRWREKSDWLKTLIPLFSVFLSIGIFVFVAFSIIGPLLEDF